MLNLMTTGRTRRVQEFSRGSFREIARARFPRADTSTRVMAHPRGGSAGKPLPQPRKSLVIDGVAVEVIGAGAGMNKLTSGISSDRWGSSNRRNANPFFTNHVLVCLRHGIMHLDVI